MILTLWMGATVWGLASYWKASVLWFCLSVIPVSYSTVVLYDYIIECWRRK